MKTFKLKGLEVMENKEDGVTYQKVTLKDGLVINREDEHGWLIEAFMSKKYRDYFSEINDIAEIMIKVKITREENDPAFFITKIADINKINEHSMNVLFQGHVIDHRKSKIEEMLAMIIEEGYQGESLLEKFKELIK